LEYQRKKSGREQNAEQLARTQAGFTLIEILVVLVIIGIVLTIGVTMYGGFSTQSKVKFAAETLAQTIEVTAEQAVLQASVLGLYVDQQGYRLLRYQQGRWRVVKSSALSRPKAFKADFDIQFKPAIKNTEKKSRTPQCVFGPSGTMTALQITIRDKNNKQVAYVVKTSLVGQVTVSHLSADNA
jgi:general secretion pathway protein H